MNFLVPGTTAKHKKLNNLRASPFPLTLPLSPNSKLKMAQVRTIAWATRVATKKPLCPKISRLLRKAPRMKTGARKRITLWEKSMKAKEPYFIGFRNSRFLRIAPRVLVVILTCRLFLKVPTALPL